MAQTIWEVRPVDAVGFADGIVLRPGTPYSLEVLTGCIHAEDYKVVVGAWSGPPESVAVYRNGALFPRMKDCRSYFTTGEFTVAQTGNYTVSWNLSREVFDSGPVVRLIAKPMTFTSAMDLICFGGLSGIVATPLAAAIYDFIRKRPPRRPRPARAPAAHPAST